MAQPAPIPSPMPVHVGPQPQAVTDALEQLRAACATWPQQVDKSTTSFSTHETACSYPEHGQQIPGSIGLGVVIGVAAIVVLWAVYRTLTFAARTIWSIVFPAPRYVGYATSYKGEDNGA